MAKTDYPSFAYMMSNNDANATTVWESWFFSNNTFSHNHPMFASHSLWMQQSLGGILPHPSARAFDRVLVKPRPVSAGRLQFANASYDSVRGRVATAWAWVAGRPDLGTSGTSGANGTTTTLELHVEVPPNVLADVHVPSSNATVHQIFQGQGQGRTDSGARAARPMRGEFDAHGQSVKFVLGGGRYTFRSTLILHA